MKLIVFSILLVGCTKTSLAVSSLRVLAEDSQFDMELDRNIKHHCTEEDPCTQCQGDCESDEGCEGTLVCYQTVEKARNDDEAAVPGCIGLDYSRTDWCVHPDDFERKIHGDVEAKSDTLMKGTRREGTFMAVLNAAQNPVTCDSDALGNGIFTYKDGLLCVYLSYQGLKNGDTENRSHIHGPAAIKEPYKNIIVTFYNRNIDYEDGTMSHSGTNKNVCYNLDKINNQEGYEEGTIENYLFDGLLLVNIHSDYCDPGEIRGQILKMG